MTKVPSVDVIFQVIMGEPNLLAAAQSVHKMMREMASGRPRMMIDGMSEADIAGAIYGEFGMHHQDTCARVAFRLANTPAPIVDPDAAAKACARVYFDSVGYHGKFDDWWDEMRKRVQDGWRAVAGVVGKI